MDNLCCIIHYSIKNCSYSKLKPISLVNKEKIYAAKLVRERYDDANYHKYQCLSIPEEIDPDIHGIHLEPCYKKFVLILSNKKALRVNSLCCSSDNSIRPKRYKTSDSSNIANVFPKECNLCKRYRIKRGQKHMYPITITTLQAVNKIKHAAETCEDKTLYFEIKDFDLFAREFKYHEFCYNKYTRKLKLSSKKSLKESLNFLKGDLDKVIECIKQKILCQNQALSMEVLHNLYGTHLCNTRYRSRLKSMILSAFGNKISFVAVNKITPEIVINADVVNAHTLLNDRDQIINQAANYLREDIVNFANTTSELNWPINLEDINCTTRKPPNSVITFLSCLFKNKAHPHTQFVDDLIQSYSADMVHGVTSGKFITQNTYCLA